MHDLPASAVADSLPSTYRSDAAQSGGDAGIGASAQFEYPLSDFRGGDRSQSEGTVRSTFPPAEFHGGDTPVDHPGASRAPTGAPTTIEVVRPERWSAPEWCRAPAPAAEAPAREIR